MDISVPARLLVNKEHVILDCLSKNVQTPKRMIESGVLSNIEFYSEHSDIESFTGIFDGSSIIVMEPHVSRFDTMQGMMRTFTRDLAIIRNSPSYIILFFLDCSISMQAFSNEVKVSWTRTVSENQTTGRNDRLVPGETHHHQTTVPMHVILGDCIQASTSASSTYYPLRCEIVLSAILSEVSHNQKSV